jgi:hypothetical protein
MTSTISSDIRQAVNLFIGLDIVCLLVNDPLLGSGSSLTPTELNYRLDYTTQIAITKEVGGAFLNGYKRSIFTGVIEDQPNNQSSFIDLEASFLAEGGSIGPATHLVYVSQANTAGATDGNGNNRGDDQGHVLLIDEILNSPLTLPEDTSYTHTITLNINAVSA